MSYEIEQTHGIKIIARTTIMLLGRVMDGKEQFIWIFEIFTLFGKQKYFVGHGNVYVTVG